MRQKVQNQPQLSLLGGDHELTREFAAMSDSRSMRCAGEEFSWSFSPPSLTRAEHSFRSASESLRAMLGVGVGEFSLSSLGKSSCRSAPALR